MNAPLSPVIPEKMKETLTLPKKKIQRSARVTLSIKDNHRLCDFLLNHTFLPGQTFEDVTQAAKQALELPELNRDHVYNRMKEFDLKLIPAPDSKADLQRQVAMLEKFVHEIGLSIVAQSCMLDSVSPELAAFLAK